MYQMVYISKASDETLKSSSQYMAEILEIATKNNSEKSVTGLLVYNSGHFLQLLEGSKESVSEIFNKIAKDKRHSNVKVILRQDVDSRLFDNWSMASCNLDLVPGHDFFKNKKAKEILQSCLDGDDVDEFRILDLIEFFRISFK